MTDDIVKQVIQCLVNMDSKEEMKVLEDYLIKGKGIIKIDLDPDGNLRTTRVEEGEG